MAISKYSFVNPDVLYILYAYADDSLNSEASRVTVLETEGKPLAENLKGKISISEGKKIHLSVNSDAFVTIDYHKKMLPRKAGGYIPPENHLFAQGIIEGDISFETGPMSIATLSMGGEQIYSVNKIVFKTPNDTGNYKRIILTTLEDHFLPFDRNSEDDLAGKHYAKLPVNYCKIPTSNSDYFLCSYNHRHYLSTEIQLNSENEQLKNEDALLLAMSFISGHKIQKIGIYEAGSFHRTELFKCLQKSGYTFFPPANNYLPDNDGSRFEMLKALQHFLLTDKNAELVNGILETFLLLGPLEPNLRTLQVCVLIEGLANILLKNYTSEFAQSKSKLIESLNSGTIDGIPALYGKRFSNILNEYNVNKMGTWNKITFLSDALNFQIELCEKKAFETRNRLAHGTFLNPYEGNFDQNQKELDNLGYVTNLFNKLVLRMAGYIGNYVNYSNNWAVDKLG